MGTEATVWLRRRWYAFWFTPTEATNLALTRIVLYAGIMVVYPCLPISNEDVVFLPRWGDVPAYFMHPVSFFSWLRIWVPSYEILQLLEWLFYVTMATSCIGIWTRTSTSIVFILGLFLWGIPQNFGKVYHTETIPVLVFGIMACSRCGDVYSIDSLCSRRRKLRSTLVYQKRSDYTWPIRLAWVLIAMSVLAAGISKVSLGGWQWLVSDQMKWNIISHHYGGYGLPKWPLKIVRESWFSSGLAWGTVAVELAGPLILVSPRLRLIIVPTLVLMQVGIWLLMGVGFTLWLVCYVVFVPWDIILQRLRSKLPNYVAPATMSPCP